MILNRQCRDCYVELEGNALVDGYYGLCSTCEAAMDAPPSVSKTSGDGIPATDVPAVESLTCHAPVREPEEAGTYYCAACKDVGCSECNVPDVNDDHNAAEMERHRPSDAKHWDISPECAAGCQPGASPCEACRYWNYGAQHPNEAPHAQLNTCGQCGGTGQAPAIRGNYFVLGETMPCPACMARAQQALDAQRPQDPLPKNSTLPTLEDAGRFIAQLYDARQEDGFRRGIRYVSEMFDGWLGQHLPRPGEARQCDSCETRPASSWCNGCIIEDHQAAEISRPDNPLQKRVNMLRIALAGAINAYDGCHSTSCHVFDAGLEDDALSEEVESGNNAGCDCGATEKRDALRVVLLGDGEAPRCSETTRAEHSCDFVEMLAWLRAYATQDEQGCRDPHPLWTEAHLTEGEAAGLVDFLAGRPWRKPSPTGSEST